MTPSDRAAMQQALDALLYHREQTRPIERTEIAIAALQARLAASEAAEALAQPQADEAVVQQLMGVVEDYADTAYPAQSSKRERRRNALEAAIRAALAQRAGVPTHFHIQFNNGRDAWAPISELEDCERMLESGERITLYAPTAPTGGQG